MSSLKDDGDNPQYSSKKQWDQIKATRDKQTERLAVITDESVQSIKKNLPKADLKVFKAIMEEYHYRGFSNKPY